MRTWVQARWRSVIVVATAVLVTVALVAGSALAQTSPTPQSTSPMATFVAKVAAKLGIPQAKVQGAVNEAQKEMIDEAVAAGHVPQAAADRFKQRVDQGHFALPPLYAAKHRIQLRLRYGLKEAADCAKLTPEELRTELRAGKSVAEAAAAKGVARADLIACLTAKVKQQLDEAVAKQTITQARADQILQRFTSQVEQFVDRKFTPGQKGPGRQRPATKPAAGNA